LSIAGLACHFSAVLLRFRAGNCGNVGEKGSIEVMEDCVGAGPKDSAELKSFVDDTDWWLQARRLITGKG
jgi:hypothetical protein